MALGSATLIHRSSNVFEPSNNRTYRSISVLLLLRVAVEPGLEFNIRPADHYRQLHFVELSYPFW